MEQQGKKGFAIAAMVLGIISCVFAWFGLVSGIISLVLAVVGLVLAIQARKSYAALGQKNGMATAGLVLSIIGIVLSVIGVIACGICVCVANQTYNAIASEADLSSLQDLADQLSQLSN